MSKANKVVAPAALIGEATAEQIAAWKEKHGFVIAIEVENEDGSTSVCYLQPADRETASLAYTHIANKRMIDAGAVFLSNGWLGGDESIKTVDRKYIAACQQAYECLDLAVSRSKKL